MAQFDGQHRSALHRKVVELLGELFPNYQVQENTPIEVNDQGRPKTLYVDIVVDRLRVCIECHGEQHFKYNAHFHKHPDDFAKQLRLDEAKRQQIELSGWAYVMVRFDEEKKLTKRKLLNRILKALESDNGKRSK